MKRKSIFVLLGSLLLSCSNEEPIPVPDSSAEETIVQSCDLRSYEEVMEIAKNAVSMLADAEEPLSRHAVRRVVDENNGLKIIRTTTKSRAEGDGALMYVVNYADSMGFAVVSANKKAPELIAVTEQGYYDPAVPNDNSDFHYYMECVANRLNEMISSNSTPVSPAANTVVPIKPAIQYKLVTDTTWYRRGGHRVAVNWGQRNPEGWECPNKLCGCSNTAAAMAMTYFKYPEKVTMTYMDDDPTVDMNWDEICLHTGKNYGYSCSCSYAVHSRISQLCRELGHRSVSNYVMPTYDENGKLISPAGTGTRVSATRNTLVSLGYSVKSEENIGKYNIAGLLDRYGTAILLVYGTNTIGNRKGASHMWVCDGATDYVVKSTMYSWQPPDDGKIYAIPQWEVDWVTEIRTCYNHFNWGWYGDGNGYFLDMNYDVTTSGGDKYDFRDGVGALVVTR